MKLKLMGATASLLFLAAAADGQEPRPSGPPALSSALQPALFADSLSTLRDVAAIREMVLASAPTDEKAPPDVHLRYALLEKRLFELTDDDGSRKRAQRSFDNAKDQDERNTWAHFGYGWALAHGPEFQSRFIHYLPGAATVSALGGIVGLDAAGRAKRSLQRALEIDPAFEPAVTELARIALLTKLPKDVSTAASASRKAIGAGRATAGIYTQLAELEMLRGNRSAAAEAARAAVKLRPDGAAQRALGIALLALPAEADAGAAAYMQGLTGTAFADSALLTAYSNDVKALLVEDDRAALRDLAPDEKASWLHTFWEKSAAKSGRTVPQRLTEHFDRMQHALSRYQRDGKFGVRGGEAFIIDGDNQDLPFDDRGLIYVRLGKPDVVISTPAGDITPPPNESWVYTRAGEVEMYHFHKFAGGGNWMLSALEPCDPAFLKWGQSASDRGSANLLRTNLGGLTSAKGGIGAEMRYLDYLTERAKYDKRLGTYMNRCQIAITDLNILAGPDTEANTGGPPSLKDLAADRLLGPGREWPYTMGYIGELTADAKVIAQRDRQLARTALKADDARPKYVSPLQAITQIYAFRGDDGGTALTAAVLIPGQRFTPAQQNGVTVYPLSLSLIVIDSASGRIQRADSKPAFRADRSVAKGQWFRATLDMQASPMHLASYSVVIENTGNAGEGDIRTGSRNVPSFAGSELMMSDLVVGEAGDGRWKRGRTDINPIPSHQVEHNKQFKLFYEVYNLAPGAKYRTTIQVAPKESGGITGAIKSIVGKKRAVELNFDDVAAPGADRYGLQQVRSIGADMEAGQYDLKVTITDVEAQKETTRTTKLVILGPKDLKNP